MHPKQLLSPPCTCAPSAPALWGRRYHSIFSRAQARPQRLLWLLPFLSHFHSGNQPTLLSEHARIWPLLTTPTCPLLLMQWPLHGPSESHVICLQHPSTSYPNVWAPNSRSGECLVASQESAKTETAEGPRLSSRTELCLEQGSSATVLANLKNGLKGTRQTCA